MEEFDLDGRDDGGPVGTDPTHGTGAGRRPGATFGTRPGTPFGTRPGTGIDSAPAPILTGRRAVLAVVAPAAAVLALGARAGAPGETPSSGPPDRAVAVAGPGTGLAGPGGRAPQVGALQFERDLAGIPAFAARVGEPGQRVLELAFVAPDPELAVSVFCRSPQDVLDGPQLEAVVTLDRRAVLTTACGLRERVHDSTILTSGPGGDAGSGPEVRVDRESVLRVEVRDRRGAPARSGVMRLGVAVHELDRQPHRTPGRHQVETR